MNLKPFRIARLLMFVLVSGLLGTAFVAGCGGEAEPPPVAPANEPGPAKPSGPP